jgi:GNAT superfamily N-acetyltransferase
MAKLEIRPLSPALLPQFLHFFEQVAFVDNPQWGRCYCQYPQAASLAAFESSSAAENRALCARRIAAGQMSGYLAFDDDQPVGWCNASPRSQVTCAPALLEPRAQGIGAIVCFLVAPDQRGRGIASALLHAACEGFAQQNYALAEAYPSKRDARSESINFPGPLSMYLRAGFHVIADLGETALVQKALTASPRG